MTSSSLMCVKENPWTKVMNFFKKVFKKDKINKEQEKEVLVAQVRTKEELMQIYNKAKKNEYDISHLELEEIKMLNELIEEEIKLKTEKLMKLTM